MKKYQAVVCGAWQCSIFDTSDNPARAKRMGMGEWRHKKSIPVVGVCIGLLVKECTVSADKNK